LDLSFGAHPRGISTTFRKIRDAVVQHPPFFPTRKAQVQGEVVLTSRQVEVINGCQLQDVEEAGEEGHSSTDGGTYGRSVAGAKQQIGI